MIFLLRYLVIRFQVSVAEILVFVVGRNELATRIADSAQNSIDLLLDDIRTDRLRRRQWLVDSIAEIDAKLQESMSPSVRNAMLRLRQFFVNFIADIDRRNAEQADQ